MKDTIRDKLDLALLRLNWHLIETREAIEMWIAFHIPRRIVYWCGIRMMSYVASQKVNTPYPLENITPLEMLKGWEERK